MNLAKKFSGTAASLFSAAALTAALLFTAVPPLQAENYEHCQRRIVHADHELHLAIERHGRHSPQADRKRVELHAARERCWSENHRWWDADAHRWHTERDWDEHDHDRD